MLREARAKQPLPFACFLFRKTLPNLEGVKRNIAEKTEAHSGEGRSKSTPAVVWDFYSPVKVYFIAELRSSCMQEGGGH
jgi:hypothetical protein